MDPTTRLQQRRARYECSQEQELWTQVVHGVRRQARRQPTPRRRPVFSDALIVLMYLWAVWHGRCLSWACDRAHYGRLFRPRAVPSVSRFTRRIKTPRCQALLAAVHLDLAEAHLACPVYLMDGKAMTVSPVSKDPDATRGRVSGGFAKGYKLHALAKQNGLVPFWAVTGLNVGECPVGQVLCQHLPPQADDALVLADTNYDDRDIGKVLAQRNCGFLTPTKGAARHPVTLRQMGPVRRDLLAIWRDQPLLARRVLRGRAKIENIFSQVWELGRLPAFVRGLDRVRRWTGAKVILHNAKVRVQRARPAAAAGG